MSFLFSCKKRRIDVTKFTTVEEFNNEKLKIGVVIGTSIMVSTSIQKILIMAYLITC